MFGKTGSSIIYFFQSISARPCTAKTRQQKFALFFEETRVSQLRQCSDKTCKKCEFFTLAFSQD